MRDWANTLGRRLIIRHGGRVTRHELSDKTVVIGRDPSCDLFFSDHRLSRRHARVEQATGEPKLVDLGSRNGSWVNEKRVEECFLQCGDTIRLGGLRIAYEEDPPVAADEEATVLLSDEGVGDKLDHTVQLSAAAAEGDTTHSGSPPDDTVLFAESRARDRDGTVVLSDTTPPEESAGTVLFPDLDEAEDGETRALPALEKTKPPFHEAEGPLGGRTVAVPESDWVPPFSPILAPVAVALAVYVLVAIPLLLKTRSELYEESLQRGRTLLRLLQAENAGALSSGRMEGLSVDSVLEEPGVKAALILDLDGRALAPRDRVGESYERIQGVGLPLREIDSIREGRDRGGNLNLVAPVTHDGRRVGLAVVTYALADMAETRWVAVLIVLGIIAIVAGAWYAVLLSRRAIGSRAAMGTETTVAETPGGPQ